MDRVRVRPPRHLGHRSRRRPVARQGRRFRARRTAHRDRLQLRPPVVLARRRRHRVRRRAGRRAARQRAGRRARSVDRRRHAADAPRSTATACRTCGARASLRGTATTCGSPPRTAATSPLYRVHADPHEDDPPGPELMVDGDRVVTGFDVAQRRRRVHVGRRRRPSPSCRSSSTASEKQLTTTARASRRRASSRSRRRSPRSSKDKTKVPCWVIPPVGAKAGKKYPTLLHIHGGPFTQYAQQAVRRVPGRGAAPATRSSTATRAAHRATARRGARPCAARNAQVEPGTGWGSVDYEDVMAAIDAAIKQFDFIDDDRLGVLGGSYGGYMTSVDRGPQQAVQGGGLGTIGQQPRADGRQLRHRHRVLRLPRPLRGRRPATSTSASRRRPTSTRHHDAAADHAFRGRLALPDRAGRGAVRRSALAGPRRGDGALPGRRPRDVAQRARRSTASSASRSSWSGSTVT